MGAANRHRRGAWLALLTLVTLVLGHELVFALRYGVGDDLAAALASTGHGAMYALLVVGIGAAGLALAVRSLARLTWLHVGVRRAGEAARDPSGTAQAPWELRRAWLALARPLILRTLVLFGLLENLEHLTSHGHIEGLAVYTAAEAWWVAPILVALGLAIALAGAVVRWQEGVLERRLARAARERRSPTATLRPRRWALIGALCHHRLGLLARDLGRAPPLQAFD